MKMTTRRPLPGSSPTVVALRDLVVLLLSALLLLVSSSPNNGVISAFSSPKLVATTTTTTTSNENAVFVRRRRRRNHQHHHHPSPLLLLRSSLQKDEEKEIKQEQQLAAAAVVHGEGDTITSSHNLQTQQQLQETTVVESMPASAVQQQQQQQLSASHKDDAASSIAAQRLFPLLLQTEENGKNRNAINTSRSGGAAETENTDNKNWVDESKHVELLGLVAWMLSLSAFVFVNNFVGPFPQVFQHVHERAFFLGHMLGGMLFGGGIILTTSIEWMACQTKNASVLTFWFDKVPLLDMALVLPGLTLSMVSGIGLTIVRYGGLMHAPQHIIYVFWALVVFAVWWGITDLTTQGSALNSVLDASARSASDDLDEVPQEVSGRLVSNLGSCFLVLVVYGIMVLKPGTIHYW